MIDSGKYCRTQKQKEQRIKEITNRIKTLTIRFSKEKVICENCYKIGWMVKNKPDDKIIIIVFKDDGIFVSYQNDIEIFSYENRNWFKDRFEQELWKIFFPDNKNEIHI